MFREDQNQGFESGVTDMPEIKNNTDTNPVQMDVEGSISEGNWYPYQIDEDVPGVKKVLKPVVQPVIEGPDEEEEAEDLPDIDFVPEVEDVLDEDIESEDEFLETGEPVQLTYRGEKPVAESVKEEDYLRFGVDPVRDKKKHKEKGPSFFKLLNPKNLQTSVEKYGYSFSAKKFYLTTLVALGAAVGVGMLFQLDWYFVLFIALLAGVCMPFVFLTSLKDMYMSKQFHDASDYMEQLLYSFRRKRKILTSLEDVLVAFEDDNGPMKELVSRAIEYIRTADSEGNIYREALDIIEEEYGNDRLRSVHNFLIAVENNGGTVEKSIDLLLDDRSMWDERVHAFQQERSTIKRNITVSIIFSLILCAAILFIFSMDILAEMHIPKNLLVQLTSTFVIMMNLLLYVHTTNKFTQSWLRKESKQSDYQILRDYFYVENFNPKKERKMSIIWALATSLIWIVGLAADSLLVVAAGAMISLFCLFSPQISYNLTVKNTKKEIQKAFPQWMMELALILQSDNVQVSISKTLNSAPPVLRPELEALVEKFEEEPNSLKPYTEFLERYQMSEIRSAMRMLYAVSTSGTVNIDEQISDLIKKQNFLMDKAEKIENSDQLAGMTSVNMVPMLFCIVKSVADMTILVFSLFSLMSSQI